MARQPRKSPPSSKRSGRTTAKARKADVEEARKTDADTPRKAAVDEARKNTDAAADGITSLTDAIKAVATGHARVRSEAAAPPPEPSLTQSVKDVASRQRKPPATREGRKGIVIYVDQDVAAAIRRLAAELNT